LKDKVSNRQKQASRTKKKIYDVSISLLKKYGFNNVSIADISKNAGVSVGTFYHYFPSKNDIIIEIFRQGDDYFKTVVAQNLKGETANEKIIGFFEYYADFNTSKGIDFVKHFYNAENKLFIKKNRYMQLLLQEIIKSGQDRHEITAEMTPEKITEILFVVVRGVIYDWCLHEGDYPMRDEIVRYVNLILKALKHE